MKAKDSTQRGKQLESRIHQIVAHELEFNSKDPALGLVTIVAVKMTGDLQHASIYWTLLGSEEDIFHASRALDRVKGRVRSALAKNLNTRLAPTLEFIEDSLREQVSSIETLLQKAQAADAQLAKKRVGQEYAAGENAYKEVRAAGADEPDFETDPGELGQEPSSELGAEIDELAQ